MPPCRAAPACFPFVHLVVASCLILVPHGAVRAQPDPVARYRAERDRLAKLSAEDLLGEYVTAGLAQAGTTAVPTQVFRFAAPGVPSPQFQAARTEIVRRGGKILPHLLDLLRREVPATRPPDRNGIPPSLTGDVLDLVVRIRDPRAAPVLAEIVDGFNRQATEGERRAALDALERLTYCSFRKVKSHRGNYHSTIEHADAVEQGDVPTNYEALARKYRDWLKGEGRDGTQWLRLAQQRARRILASEDLDAIYCVATFLQPHEAVLLGLPGRDDAPDKTLDRLAELVGRFRRAGNEYQYGGQRIPVTVYNWRSLITGHGPRARPHALLLIHLQEETGVKDFGGFGGLRDVGGAEVLAYLVECLPRIEKEMLALGFRPDSKEPLPGGDPRLALRDSLYQCRWAIDRWAGRPFTDDAERVKWWQANKDKSPEQWLRDNLDFTVGRADAGDREAQQLVWHLLPDLPNGKRQDVIESSNSPGGPIFLGLGPVTSDLTRWLQENRRRLKYDPTVGALCLEK